MDRDAIDLALHEIQQMIEVSIRAAERLQGVKEDNGVLVSQMPRADHELLDFSLFDLARRVKASRAMIFEGDRPVSIKPASALDRARSSLKNNGPPVRAGGFFLRMKTAAN
jgi:hypothetical protein